jgi:hypothetical protein
MWRLDTLCRPMTLALAAGLAFAGCAHQLDVARLQPAEQNTFAVYKHVMSGRQQRAYLTKDTETQRASYLREIGIAQRFESLDAKDREAALHGMPRVGMSAEALRFTWGDPDSTDGWAGHYEHWYYLGNSLSLAATGNQRGSLDNEVDVQLTDGRVESWNDFTPDDSDDGGEERHERHHGDHWMRSGHRG